LQVVAVVVAVLGYLLPDSDKLQHHIILLQMAHKVLLRPVTVRVVVAVVVVIFLVELVGH
jgi:hypothetical protein